MTADQQFLKSAHIRPDDSAKEQWMRWRDDDVWNLRLKLAESATQIHNAGERAIAREDRINMWKLAAFAGWLLAFLIGMEGHW